jgi:DNA-binding XRE family transcriptional regulator
MAQTCVYTIDILCCFCQFLRMRPRQRSEPESILALQQFYKEVGRRVREARQRANNMTQKALAMTVGLTRTSLTNIEKGRQKMLLHTFTDIAIALGVGVADLLPGNEKILSGLQGDLLASLAPEERGFIERAIGAGGSYEIKQTTSNKNESKRITGSKPHHQRPS